MQANTSRTELSQGQDVYQQIIADIRTGKLRPGERLTETELALRFGLSRTPVREALRQLESDGLVCHTPRIGTTIRRLDYAEISELYEMRAVLEATAARLAARAASDVEIAELQAIHEAMQAAATPDELYLLNQQFHAALHDAARNRFLVSSVAAIRRNLLILGPSTMQEDERAAAALREHEAILAALKKRDAVEADSVMRHHIEAAHRARLRQYRQRSQQRQREAGEL